MVIVGRSLLDVVDWLFHLGDFGIDHDSDRCYGSTIFVFHLLWKVVGESFRCMAENDGLEQMAGDHGFRCSNKVCAKAAFMIP